MSTFQRETLVYRNIQYLLRIYALNTFILFVYSLIVSKVDNSFTIGTFPTPVSHVDLYVSLFELSHFLILAQVATCKKIAQNMKAWNF